MGKKKSEYVCLKKLIRRHFKNSRLIKFIEFPEKNRISFNGPDFMNANITKSYNSESFKVEVRFKHKESWENLETLHNFEHLLKLLSKEGKGLKEAVNEKSLLEDI